jgi:hypothetical protein
MRLVVVHFIHFVATPTLLLGPDCVRSIIAESFTSSR